MWRRLFYRQYRWVSSARYWLTRRFTKAGFLVLTGLAMTAGMSLDPDQAMAYQAFAFLFCLLLVSVIFSGFFRARFALSRQLPRYGTVGEPVAYSVAVRNLSSKLQRGLVLMETLQDPRASFLQFWEGLRPSRRLPSFRLAKSRRPLSQASIKEQPVPAVLPGAEVTVPMQLWPLQRGRLRFTGAAVARTDPFGLFRSFAEVHAPQSMTILPRRYAVGRLPLPGTLKYQPGGITLASSVGESEEFVALRDYRHGDPMRFIHWKSWAKVDKPIVKEFQDEFFVRHALVLDTYAGPHDTAIFEEAVSVAASFAWAIPTRDSLLDLLFVGAQAFCFTAGRGVAHAEQMLEILASVTPSQAGDFSELHQLVLQHVSSVSGCICVFLDWNEPRQALVKALRALNIPVLVLVVAHAGETAKFKAGPLQDQLASWRVLEAGKTAETLLAL
jgi:uncharacterized protein (DUF58 family)